MSERWDYRLTWLEVFVVLLIISVLVTLLLPAIQTVSSRRRPPCMNNLRQLGLAMHSYHDAHNVFPPGIVAEAYLDAHHCSYTAAENAGKHRSSASGFTLLLPFLEEQRLYSTYNQSLGCATVANSTAASRFVNVFLCPTNQGQLAWISSQYSGGMPARTDYVLSAGASALLTCASPFEDNASANGYPKPLRPSAGAFNVNSSVRLSQIRDGSSNTFLAGEGASGVPHGLPEFGAAEPTAVNESAVVEQAWSQGYIGSTGGNGGYGSIFAATAYDAWYDSDGKLGPADGSEKGFTPLRMRTGNLAMMRGTTYQASLPNGIESADPGKPRLPTGAISISPFRSFHRGICHFLFADGSVRTLADNVDARVFVGLSTVAGNEQIDDSAF